MTTTTQSPCMYGDTVTTLELEGEREALCIPIQTVYEASRALPSYSHLKVMFWVLAETGARIQALDNMRRERLIGDVLYWNDGKGKGHHRAAKLSPQLLEELTEYRRFNRVYDSRLFGISAESFRRSFNGEGRALLGGEWKVKVIRPRETLRIGYKYQLKGLRKNFATKRFKDYWEKYQDASVAVQFTARDMKHKSDHITTTHYIKELETLGKDIPKGQKSLLEYF